MRHSSVTVWKSTGGSTYSGNHYLEYLNPDWASTHSIGKCHTGKSHGSDHCSPPRPSNFFLYSPHKALWWFFLFWKLRFSPIPYHLVRREPLRSLDHNQPWGQGAKAQPQSGLLPSRQTVKDNLALYYCKPMVTSLAKEQSCQIPFPVCEPSQQMNQLPPLAGIITQPCSLLHCLLSNTALCLH